MLTGRRLRLVRKLDFLKLPRFIKNIIYQAFANVFKIWQNSSMQKFLESETFSGGLEIPRHLISVDGIQGRKRSGENKVSDVPSHFCYLLPIYAPYTDGRAY